MYWHLFGKLIKESLRDLLPIIAVILFFQLAVIQAVPAGWEATAIGMGIVAIGLAVFLLGLEIGIFPVGEQLARDFATSRSAFWVLFFGFMIGFGTTIAEPALVVIADKAAAISSGRIDATVLRLVVALSVGFAILLGVYRILKGHPIHYYIITGYVLVVSITFFAPPEIIGLAYDLGGVTTSTVTVPLVAALGIGLASSIKGRNPMIDGFGLIAMASLTPMIFVQIYGIAVYNLVEAKDVAEIVVDATASTAADITPMFLLNGLLKVCIDVLPILGIILFFQFVVLRKPINNWREVTFGFFLVILGLDAFILGLEMGLFSLGESMALQLTQLNSNWLIYIFAGAIGFSTTLAEPALIAISKKAVEISDGRVNDLTLRLFVAVGVAVGITLGSFRIIDGGHIHYYIIVGYIVVIALTSMAPKYIIPIAYDSGGVTTSTVTVPLVAALGIGLASNIEGRSPLIDGFGLIAFASLFPMITVMLYGVITAKLGVKSDSQLAQSNKIIMPEAKPNLAKKSVILKDTEKSSALHEKLSLEFNAVVAIIPADKKEIAVEAAKSAGASGVTIIDAEGMGLSKFDNLFRVNHEASDAVLVFLLPNHMVDTIIDSIINRLHITTTGDGIIFSFPINQLNGISLRQKDIFQNIETSSN